jgi:predicted TIM-barrel fold metal-dependent hydrolase
MPILIHADLRKHGPFIEEMVRTHPYTNFNLPHFGFSRWAISPLLERYPNCYTDLSSMVPFMKKDAASYKSYIQRYQDKILFGSDALIDQPDQIQSVLKSVSRILGDEGILHKVMHRNYNLFHAPHSEVYCGQGI